MIPFHAKSSNGSEIYLLRKTENFFAKLFPGARLHVERLVAVSPNGIVYRVRSKTVEVTLCARLVPRRAEDDSSWRADLQTLARLRNPFLITLYRVVQTSNGSVIVSEWIDQPRLDTWVTTVGPLDPVDTIRLGLQLACGLGELHMAGARHGQVTPRNVAFLGGLGSQLRTALMDFEPSKRCAEHDSQADVRGIGSVLRFALTGGQVHDTQPGIPTILWEAIRDMETTSDGLLCCQDVTRRLSTIRRRIATGDVDQPPPLAALEAFTQPLARIRPRRVTPPPLPEGIHDEKN